MKRKLSLEDIGVGVFAYSFLIIFSLLCLLPFLVIISGSFTKESAILEKGFSLIPPEFSLDAFKAVFAIPKNIINAYIVTIFVTTVGTFLSVFLSTLAAYVLQKKDFKYRNFFAFYFYFTTIFSGGIVPWYILMTQYLHMKNNILALILPGVFNVFNLIIIRSFISSSIPSAIVESAQIDGASEWHIFFKLILPLSKPILATIGLFTALGYWNDWFNAMLFIDKQSLMPLQYYLYKMLSQISMLRTLVAQVPQMTAVTPPEESFKMAMTVITIGPILLLYPFVQKYFVTGIMIGAVKE